MIYLVKCELTKNSSIARNARKIDLLPLGFSHVFDNKSQSFTVCKKNHAVLKKTFKKSRNLVKRIDEPIGC